MSPDTAPPTPHRTRPRNWAGNVGFSAPRIERPESVGALRELVARTQRIRALGVGHSFSAIADAPAMVSLAGLPLDAEVDAGARRLRICAGATYVQVAEALRPHGLALENLASLTHVSVAGAVATATHGGGAAHAGLAAQVAAVERIGADGEETRLGRGEPEFDALLVAAGAAGILTRVELDLVPVYELRQTVLLGAGWPAVLDGLDAILAAGHSTSVMTTWTDAPRIFAKHPTAELPDALAGLDGARPARGPEHPIPGEDPVNCTPQLGLPGPWDGRLPHFRAEFRPSSGDELQSEYLVPREDGRAAVAALRAIGPRLAAAVQVSELRGVAADPFWLSPQFERDSIGLHFTWRPDPKAVRTAVARVEAALAPFAPRPHWGKVHGLDPAACFPRFAEAARARDVLDPGGKFGRLV